VNHTLIRWARVVDASYSECKRAETSMRIAIALAVSLVIARVPLGSLPAQAAEKSKSNGAAVATESLTIAHEGLKPKNRPVARGRILVKRSR
jgi:hypothetical protein